MSDFFITLLNMSLVTIPLIMVLLIIRPFVKRAPKAFLCALWGLVGIRLICPFSFESFMSLLPTAEPISKDVISARTVTEGAGALDGVNNGNVFASDTLASEAATVNYWQIISMAAAFIWLSGVAVMIIISLISYLRLAKRVSASVNIGTNVYINDDIPSPFVLGIIKPRIYIPSTLNEYEKEYVIAHENAHIKRRDYIIKPFGYALLSLHWFNPFVWLAYVFLCRDIESACDERVVCVLDDTGKKNYSEILLRLSVPNKALRACPVAFGEIGIKSRVRSVLSYKKPAFWVMVLSVLLVLGLSAGFMTNPVKAEHMESADNFSSEFNEQVEYTSEYYEEPQNSEPLQSETLGNDTASDKVVSIETIDKSSDTDFEDGTSFVIYSDATSERYFKEPLEERTYIYDCGNIQILTEGTYFTLNEDAKTFLLVFKTGKDSSSPHKLCTGNYEANDDLLILYSDDSDVENVAFVKDGDYYIYSESDTVKYNGHGSDIFTDGDRFIFSV